MRYTTTKPIVTSIILWAALTGAALASCAPDRVSLRGEFGQADFSVEIADDPQERAVGLMNRDSLPRSDGMLFVYDKPGPLSFWMRNTLIPLDMLFVNPDGSIGHIHHSAVPLDETPISGGEGRIAVLEINGGLSKKLGLKAGDQLRHPAIDQAIAVWACDDA